LPVWLQPVALALPPTYVFEGLRSLVQHGFVSWRDIGLAFGLNLAYLGGGYFLFLWFLQRAREAGSLVQMGE
jgi:ABC-2 type transport system permease protein